MRSQVVVVGGGIAGSALACGLASAGLDVLVLEASLEFEDRVRGESMQAWGVAEARALGVEDVLLGAGAHMAPTWRQYSTARDEPGEIPMWAIVPDVGGSLNLRHPDACQALLDAAAAAGATIERGVRDVTLASGGVTFRVDDRVEEVGTDLVVGADGRASTVRKQGGISLERSLAMTWIAGLLVDGLDGVPDDHDAIAESDDAWFLLFHQGGGRARSYIVVGESGRSRFTGPGGADRFRAAAMDTSFPWAAQVAGAEVAGPCATYAGDDSWTAAPYAEGVVLVGDAAGYNDPIIGQGLSIAMRDARTVRDLVVDGGTAADLRPYADERLERMRRLRLIADVMAVTHAEDADNRVARRAWLAAAADAMAPDVFPLVVGGFAGPETVPADLVDDSILDRIRSA